MWRNAFLFVTVAFFFHIVMEYRIWLDLDKVLHSKTPGECSTILKEGGSEDFVELDEDTILVSSVKGHDSPIGQPGKIFAVYTNGSAREVPVVGTDKDPLLSPVGLSVWKDPKTGEVLLYVITHGPIEEGVAVFTVTKHPLTLYHIKTITDNAFNGIMNDLAVVGRDQFYITRSVWWRHVLTFLLEMVLGLPSGQLVYYDGMSGRVVKSGLRVANGVAVSNDNRVLYVAETTSKKVHALTIDKNGDVHTKWVVDLGSAPDNILVHENGDLWIGCSPKIVANVDIFQLAGPPRPAAQVLRVRISDNGVTDVEDIFTNDGRDVTGSSVAIYKHNKLFIGTVRSQLVMCDVHYLSK